MDFQGLNTDMTTIHEELYKILIDYRTNDNSLRFTFRKSNHGNRMEDGYWFYGNDQYLAISFWTGMDWKNRTPNIVFIISNTGECWLELNVSDSDSKRKFVEEYMINNLNLEVRGRKYIKRYNTEEKSTTDVFVKFLMDDKKIIDNIITEYSYSEGNTLYNKENLFGFISKNEFLKRHNKIKKYRILKHEEEKYDISSTYEEKPHRVIECTLKDYGQIKEVSFKLEDFRNQWVFITGENGSGKTNFLRALSTVLGYRYLSKKELDENPKFSCELKLLNGKREVNFSRLRNEGARGKKRAAVQGFAMYGPYRLDKSTDRITLPKLKKLYLKEGSFDSLFKAGTPLINLDKQIDKWIKGSRREKELLEKRKYFITSVLTDIVPNLYDVWFKEPNGTIQTSYIFRDNEASASFGLTWNKLPSGTKCTISMIGDILLRFYDQQRNIIDPSEFKGIVIIDEIDLHLHPQAQRDLVENLTKVFPGIQFIVSTHSPIPLLGANKHAVFFRMNREHTTVSLTRLKYIEKYIEDLMPQHLLTSDLFGLNSLTSIRKENLKEVYTGTSMSTYIEHKALQERKVIVSPDSKAFLDRISKKFNEKGS